MSTKYWLMKTEPDAFSIDDLKNRPNKTEHWDGVRNFQARNMMRHDMQLKDLVLFYHSSCKEPGIYGIAEVVKTGYPDPSAFDPDSKYFDPTCNPEKPKWYMVDVKFKKKLKDPILLSDLRNNPKLKDMIILRRGNRLSITPVTEKEWENILRMIE